MIFREPSPRVYALFLLLPFLAPATLAAQGAGVPDPTSPDSAQVDSIPPGPASPDSITTDPVPFQRAAQDLQTEAELRALLQRIPGLEGVDLGVEAGIAFLTGTVLSLDDRALADSLVRKGDGIVYVDNRIREETSLGSRLGPLADRLQEKLLAGVAYLPLLLLAALVVVAFFLLAGVLSRWEAPYRRMAKSPFLRTLLQQFFGGTVVLLGVLLALELLDATALVGAVLGAAGVAGVAVGFAFRNIAENYLAGILLSIRQPFSADDQIQVEGQEGRVIRLTSRETILMTLDGNHVRIPNATIFNSVIVNYTRNPLRRFGFDLSVGQGEDLSHVQKVGLGSYSALSGVLPDPPPRSVIKEVGDSWVLLRFFGWTNQDRTGFDKVRSEAIRLAKEGLDRAGVTMPAPEYGVRFLSEGGVPAGIPRPGEPPLEAARRRDPPAGPVPPGAGTEAATPPVSGQPPDLSPDRALDSQIAEDREKTAEKDLLGSGPPPEG